MDHIIEIDPAKKLSDLVMFDGDLDVQLGGKLPKGNDPKLTVMGGVEKRVLLFCNNVSKIPIVHQMVSSQNTIHNIFGSWIYNKNHAIFKF